MIRTIKLINSFLTTLVKSSLFNLLNMFSIQIRQDTKIPCTAVLHMTCKLYNVTIHQISINNYVL